MSESMTTPRVYRAAAVDATQPARGLSSCLRSPLVLSTFLHYCYHNDTYSDEYRYCHIPDAATTHLSPRECHLVGHLQPHDVAHHERRNAHVSGHLYHTCGAFFFSSVSDQRRLISDNSAADGTQRLARVRLNALGLSLLILALVISPASFNIPRAPLRNLNMISPTPHTGSHPTINIH